MDYSDLKKYKNLFENVFPNKQFEDNENKRGVCTLNRLNDESRELLDKLTKKIALKGYSRETSKSYTSNITHFMAFSKNNVINSELIELYIMYLLKEKKCKTSTINQIISSLIFFCKYILEDYSLIEPIEHLKKEKRLPVVLNQDEVKKLLNSIDNLKHRAIFYTLYSSGLRLSEVIRLKASCIDPQRELIFVSGGKGKKDRYSLLSAKTLNVLLQYMEDYKPENWLFPGQRKGTHLSKRSVQHLCKG
ncbi:MAG: tyrosine-type recombinase/integrase [Spirochaetales bacterium]|nr:tyrosine-type recombinase/integrase [Spirochaetales bacterium]